ncbi:CocE/NonD family hydrolase [uncultured Shimia sp.]|uniref:CocE/NonD family hydrolase n=1 Tax=uncultured Shimia sp. TaxID=573152 RepID=UPI0025F0F257|nr:CocE/NonD family hydrolase [uncultured Shimia sp.]
MQIVDEFPFEVQEDPHVWIEMPDGVRLSARMWLPKTAEPVPAILEYLPYRKRDGTAERDALTHPYLAGHGYVCVRVDMRGCGDSEGLFEDEYSPQELDDGIAVIEWLSRQSWCNGNVGMMGISWGGFNGLQIAALAPPALKAIASLCSTVDRFADDIHYKGGVMLGENPAWAATVLGWFALPPDPQIVGPQWREMWLNRLKNTPFLAETWAKHQNRDAYWKHGSVCEDYSAIQAAVLSVGGWHDGYRNTISHLVENLASPVKGLIGPWNHKYPHFAVPGPQIDFLGELLLWWDHWLKGKENEVASLPDMRRWLMDSVPPQVTYDLRPGRWIADGVGSKGSVLTLHLDGEILSETLAPAERQVLPELAVGQAAGEFFPFGFGPGELPDDQRSDDIRSSCFDGDPIREALDLVGAPRLRVKLRSNTPKAQIAVRLCDVHPCGESTLITHGFLNLRHREGHEALIDVPIGENFDAVVSLDQCAYHVPQGHKLRVALSTSYWPFVWPESELTTLDVVLGAIELPIRNVSKGDEWRFDPPKSARPRPTKRLSVGDESKRVIRDIGKRLTRQEIQSDDGGLRDLETGLESRTKHREVFSIGDTDPNSATASFVWERDMSRGDWGVAIKAELDMSADSGSFFIKGHLQAKEGGKVVFQKEWDVSVPRL